MKLRLSLVFGASAHIIGGGALASLQIVWLRVVGIVLVVAGAVILLAASYSLV